jgi:hypothetical protein
MKSQDQILLEQAYERMNVTSDQEFSYFSGRPEDVMFLEGLDVPNLKRKVEGGNRFKTSHVAFKNEDSIKRFLNQTNLDPSLQKQIQAKGTAVGNNYPDTSGHDYYVFDTPQDFTHIALIPF